VHAPETEAMKAGIEVEGESKFCEELEVVQVP
jgi:hypothetical protein